jgi:PAS domain S-box-containing protein
MFSLTDLQIAEHDWSGCPLGTPPEWPHALRSIMTMMLACPSPMFLGWGPDLLCFYNDAYHPILGYRVDTALGRPFREVWSDVWEDVEPMVSRALSGEGCTASDMLLDLRRNGVPEESWWTFSYSPVFDDAGKVAGFLAVTRETTAQVLAERAGNEAERRRELALSAGNSIGMWDWDVAADRVTSTSRFAALYGLQPDRASDGVPFAEFLKQVHPDDRARLQSEIAAAIDACGSFQSNYRLLQADGSVRWVSAQGRAIADVTGRCVRFPGVTYDITDLMGAELALAAAKEHGGKLIE